MTFEPINAPIVFMDLKNRVFQPYLDKFMVIFIDNILIYSKDKEEHAKHLRMLLETFTEHQVYARRKKYKFLLDEVVSLEHVVSKQGIKADP